MAVVDVRLGYGRADLFAALPNLSSARDVISVAGQPTRAQFAGPVFSAVLLSSRRGNTRFDCDWSSDVCSSDLLCVKVFLLDEPLSNLDAKLRGQTRVELQKLHRDLQTTFIYVTHDQVEAMTMGDRIAIMNAEIGRASCRERV